MRLRSKYYPHSVTDIEVRSKYKSHSVTEIEVETPQCDWDRSTNPTV